MPTFEVGLPLTCLYPKQAIAEGDDFVRKRSVNVVKARKTAPRKGVGNVMKHPGAVTRIEN